MGAPYRKPVIVIPPPGAEPKPPLCPFPMKWWEVLREWDRTNLPCGGCGGDISPVYAKLVATMPTTACSMSVRRDGCMTGWTVWQDIRLGKSDVVRHTLVPFTATRTGHVDAILAAWRAELADGVPLSTFPGDPETHWKQGVVTMGTGLDVEAGRRYILELIFSSQSTKFRWAVQRVADDDRDPRVELAFGLGRAVELTT